MERIRNQIRLLQVCLLLWIGITVSVAQVTIEESSTGPTGSSPMANTDWPGDTAQATQTQGHEAKCHLFNCMGEHCYANESLPENSANGTCTTYCALYRHNSSFYESKCDEHCNHHLCNESAPDGCTMRCCNSKECTMSPNTRNNGTLDNSTAMSSTAVMSTPASTMSSTTTTTIVYSDKKCRSFKCDGTDCYKTASQTIQCQVGINHCELQKIVKNSAISYEGGCSNTCSTSTKSCTAITNGNCFQECCNATSAVCCMKLDGQVHFNTAPLVRKGSILKIITCAFFVIFISRFISSSHA